MTGPRRRAGGNFNPRSPCGERRSTVRWGDVYSQFQSTLSLRRATLGGDLHLDFAGISIHALLAESDSQARRRERKHDNFNPRSPCGERPPGLRCPAHGAAISIHALLAESDDLRRDLGDVYVDFNPRSPCGERLRRRTYLHREGAISIHALLAESDVLSRLLDSPLLEFQSTLSLRRATVHGYDFRVRVTISIHALLAESDSSPTLLCPARFYFNPRSPCGERRMYREMEGTK